MTALETSEVFVRINPGTTYGYCPECRANVGQQCSTGLGFSGWVHALREHGGVGGEG